MTMKNHQRNISPPHDTPATRKRRLQARLQEITEKSEQEMATLMKSLDKVRASFKAQKS